MKTLTAAFLLTLSLSLTFAQNATNPILKLHQPLEQQIKAGETQTFQIALHAGEFVHLGARQKDVDIVLRLYAPSGQLLVERDSPNEFTGTESLSFLVTKGGVYKLIVSVWGQSQIKEGTYVLELDTLRSPIASDRIRLKTERLFREAVVLSERERTLTKEFRTEAAREALTQAQAKYQACVPLWRELGDKYWLALTLAQISSNESRREAAQLFAELEDNRQAQQIWMNLGNNHKQNHQWEQAQTSYEQSLSFAKKQSDAVAVATLWQLLLEVKRRLHLVEGQRLYQTGLHTEALSLLNKLRDEPTPALALIALKIDVLETLGQIYLDTGDFTKSQESYTQAYQIAKILSLSEKAMMNSRNLERVRQRRNTGTTQVELVVQTGHSSSIQALAFSPNGKILASVGWDKAIKLWDIASGLQLRNLVGHTQSVHSVAFSPDGKMLASASADQTIKLWDITSGKEKHTLVGELGSFAFSPDSKMLASKKDKTIKIWDVKTGTQLRLLTDPAGWGGLVAFSPDGKTLADASKNKTIRLWDIASSTLLRTISVDKGWICYIAFSTDGRTLAIVTSEQSYGASEISFSRWGVDSGKQQRILALGSGKTYATTLSPDSKTFASTQTDFTIKIQSGDSSQHRHTFTGHTDNILTLAFSSDSRLLASADDSEVIKIWDATSGAEVQTFTGQTNWLNAVAFTSNGKVIAAANKKMIRLWDVTSGSILHTFTERHAGQMVFEFAPVYALAFAPEGKTLASFSLGDKTFWDVENGNELKQASPLPSWAVIDDSLTLKRINGKTILVHRDGGQLDYIDYASGNRIFSLLALNQGEWVLVTPSGLFDASPGAMKWMHFVISGIDEGYAVVTLEQMKDRYYQPNLLAKLLGYDNTPIKEIPPFTGEKLFPKLEYKLQEKDQTKLDINLHNRGGGIGEVAVLVNGKTFLQDARPRGFNPNSKDASFTVELKDAPFLPGAANQIEVVARNAEGWLTSPRGVKATYTPAAAAAKPDAELWAIVGGVSDYEGTQLDLHFAAKDAEDFANAIKLGGYRLFGANRVHLQTLTTNTQDPKLLPTKENFRRVFTEFQKAKPNDVLLVYLSGHGVAFRVNGDKVLYNYLTQAATNGDVKDSDVRGKVAITSDELMEWIRLIPANKNVLVFDTCAAGAFADNLNLALKKDEAGEHLDNQKIAMEDLKYRMGFHILMGAAADKPSYETSQFNQGLLTYALLEGVKFGAVNDKKIVNVSEWFQYARGRVPKLAESIGNVNIQTPQIAAPQGETFPLLQMTENETELIRLEQERPILMRPRLVNLNDPDDVEVENRLIRQLKAASQPVKRGEAARSPSVVFLETWELPSAIKPSGSYKYDGERVTVNLRLLRNKQTVGTLTVTGQKNDLPGLIEKIIGELATTIEKLPKAGVQTK